MKKITLFLFAILCTGALNRANGLETISKSQMMDKDQAHRELLGKVKKLEGDAEIYVGAGSSDAGEPIFFAMEKLDNNNTQTWINYANVLQNTPGVIRHLKILNANCDNQAMREDLQTKGNLYDIELMDKMCPNKKKFSTILGENGTVSGIGGFTEMLSLQNSKIYVAYASTQPITGPFGPKQAVVGRPTPKAFESAYPDIIMAMCIEVELEHPTAEHRGIFKNPFYDIQNKFKNIGMKFHGWAGTVEEQIFHKIYTTIHPTLPAAKLLQQSVKPGDMYIGVTNCKPPYVEDKEALKKFPPIQKELIGHCGREMEAMHSFKSKVLSKYYTGN